MSQKLHFELIQENNPNFRWFSFNNVNIYACHVTNIMTPAVASRLVNRITHMSVQHNEVVPLNIWEEIDPSFT